MRCTLILLVILSLIFSANAQTPLDYTGYTLTYYDEFDYPNFSDPVLATVGILPRGPHYSDNWTTLLGYPGPPYSSSTDECASMSQVHLSPPGSIPSFISLTENNDPTGSCSLLTGMLMGYSNPTSYGIIQIRARFPASSHYADPAFWVKNNTEIDFPDDAVYTDWNQFKVWDWTYYDTYGYFVDMCNVSSTDFAPFGIVDLTGWHTYSALWTPSSISYYVDDHPLGTRPFSDMRIYPDPAPIEAILHTNNGTADPGQQLDIDWVKIFNKTCSDEALNVPDKTFSFFGTYVIIPDEYLYNTIVASSLSPITTDIQNATVFEAQSTIIQANFLADESNLIWGYYPNLNPTSSPSSPCSSGFPAGEVKKNGFFEINSLLPCTAAPPCSLGPISGPETICKTDIIYYFGNTASGGTWQTDNSAVVINPVTGVIEGTSITAFSGIVTISYLLGPCRFRKQ